MFIYTVQLKILKGLILSLMNKIFKLKQVFHVCNIINFHIQQEIFKVFLLKFSVDVFKTINPI